MSRSALVALLPFVLVALPAAAGEQVLTLDPAASSVRFTLDATLHTVHGTFAVSRGSVTFAAVPGPATGEIVVSASSGETGDRKRDAKMHGEVLLSAAHPEIAFVPERLAGELPAAGRGTLEVKGVMRVLGAEHPVTLPLEVEVNGAAVRVTSSFKVPYVAWGLEDPSVFVLRVGKEVAVEVEAKGTLASPLEAAAADAGEGATP
jgi:polyisoprenoid-binding protein YceI